MGGKYRQYSCNMLLPPQLHLHQAGSVQVRCAARCSQSLLCPCVSPSLQVHIIHRAAIRITACIGISCCSIRWLHGAHPAWCSRHGECNAWGSMGSAIAEACATPPPPYVTEVVCTVARSGRIQRAVVTMVGKCIRQLVCPHPHDCLHAGPACHHWMFGTLVVICRAGLQGTLCRQAGSLYAQPAKRCT